MAGDPFPGHGTAGRSDTSPQNREGPKGRQNREGRQSRQDLQGRPVAEDGPATGTGWAPVPPSFEALRKVVATQAPALGPGRVGVRLLLLVAVAATLVGGVHAWWSRPEPEPLAPPTPISGAPLRAPAAARVSSAPVSSAPVAELTVHVTGKVRRPGVITLSVGSRVADAVRAAGGVRGSATTGSLNLARRIVDGEQIVVGAPSRAAPLTAPHPGAPMDPASAVVDLNTATPDQLELLPGVGEVLARRITEYRDAHGGFRAVEELRDVSGIGDRKYAEMRDRVRV